MEHPSLHILDHPLIQHKLTYIRDKNTGPKDFRELLQEISSLMAYELTRHMPMTDKRVETPVSSTVARVLTGKKVGLVPILRAGLGMVDGVLQMIPAAKIGHVGLYRDPDTMRPVHYYAKLPTDIEERDFIVMDPMLATGGSASATLQILHEKKVRSVQLMCLVAAPEGVERVLRDHPHTPIYVASVDEFLNERGYIVPGLGDAGDRLFGTQ
ncbi:uracil phosphoribosyltransferase [Pasteuria penetrans]|uniref:uracil phosphoribosyltransferase n=1 Tax=Pasteuria penetrans TaxID=86005 RepID=UPI000F94365A|nr:uracil phosphoribosyltransferase [Pasteuria penetrans]